VAAIAQILRRVHDGGLALGGCVGFLVLLGLWYAAGEITAQTSGRIADGTIAGLVAGTLAGAAFALSAPLVGLLISVLPAGGPAVLIIGTAGSLVTSAALLGGLGAGAGALGGMVGRERYRKAQSRRPQVAVNSNEHSLEHR
jgi:hypothetical protein